MKKRLDPSKVPPSCAHLIFLAERWGIGDDIYREEAVSEASTEELHSLVKSIRSLPDESMYEWLAGPESFAATPSEEYLAFTCMSMAYDSARLKLKKRERNQKGTPNQAL